MSEVTIDETKLTRLKDGIVFITGGAQGLGLAAAMVFQRLGSKVIIGDLRIPSTRISDFDYLQCDITSWLSGQSRSGMAHWTYSLLMPESAKWKTSSTPNSMRTAS
jgi:NAD(P)-dependent dehydrogenase (short-subunit alcohol dehydrogenase family)